MVYRYSWIAGIGAIGLAFWELSFLLRDSSSGTPWQVAILVATLLGAGITWTAIAYRAHAGIVIAVNLIAFALTVGLLVAPDTLWAIFPTRATWDTVWDEMGKALEVIQYGVEPVRPVPGLVVMLGALFWTLGFLLVAGLLNGRPFVAILTPLIVALQFVIIDRRPKGMAHLAVFVGVVALSLLAIRLDERDSGSGRLHRVNGSTRPTKRPSPAIVSLVVVTVVMSLTAVAVAGDRVPTDGLVSWRSPAGFSDEYSGSVSYNPFTTIRSQIISQTTNPVFRAEVTGVDPQQVRFRTVTLDTYRNGRWMTDRVRIFPVDEEPWIDENQVYTGETVGVQANIQIDNLRQPWLPAPVTPLAVQALDERDQRDLRVRRVDGSLMLPGGLSYEGMTYAVLADMPRYDGPTLAALALTQSGTLSPLFRVAEENGEILPDFGELPEQRELPDEEYWLEYPEDEIGPGFAPLARDVVGNVDTNFEKALALENWFRDSGEFVYDDQVPGAYATGDVMTWLSDADGSLTDESGKSWARHGYCEQFSTAMALMARAVGVPSRVVLGFTPGTKLNDTTVQVLDRNAHAWVEMWIPSYGWMAFDPTPRSSYSERTANDALADTLGFSPAEYLDDIPDLTFVDTDGGQIGPDGPLNPDRRDPITPALGGGASEETPFTIPAWVAPLAVALAVLLVLALIAPATKWARRRRYSRRLDDGDIAAAWEDIVDRLTDLRESVDPADTPLEAARSIDTAFVPLADEYGRSLYGDHEVTTATIDRASDARLRAEQHLTTRYSSPERLRALYRPSRLIARWRRLRASLSLRR